MNLQLLSKRYDAWHHQMVYGVDSEKMSDIEKMDKGFNGKTFVINGIEIDF